MIAAKINVMLLATIMGRLLPKMPYINHIRVPVVKSEYIPNDMPEVSFV